MYVSRLSLESGKQVSTVQINIKARFIIVFVVNFTKVLRVLHIRNSLINLKKVYILPDVFYFIQYTCELCSTFVTSHVC